MRFANYACIDCGGGRVGKRQYTGLCQKCAPDRFVDEGQPSVIFVVSSVSGRLICSYERPSAPPATAPLKCTECGARSRCHVMLHTEPGGADRCPNPTCIQAVSNGYLPTCLYHFFEARIAVPANPECTHKYGDDGRCEWCRLSRSAAERNFCLGCGDAISEHQRENNDSLCVDCVEDEELIGVTG